MVSAHQRVGEYVLEEKIGQGTFGEVWRARHHIWAEQVVAVKIPTDAGFVRNLQKEGLITRGLDHPGIVRPLNFDPYADPPYLVMEYVPGVSLRQLIRRGPLRPADAVAALGQVLGALAHAHAQGLVHRDVKPENILIDERAGSAGFGAPGGVKLTDFGLGKSGGSGGEDSIQFSAAFDGDGHGPAGTRRYMAPEQFAGGDVDHRADLYACGVILFEMLTGEQPAGTELPSEINPATPKYLDKVFRRAYARLDRRYANAREFLDDLAVTGLIREDIEEGLRFARRTGTWRPYLKKTHLQRLADWQSAAESGNPAGQFLLAMCLNLGVGVGRDWGRAFGLFKAAAGAGHLPSLTLLGECYEDGEGVPRDKAAAAECYRRAAGAGDPDAMVDLGWLYAFGEGLPKDGIAAAKWFQAAADRGSSGGWCGLGHLYQEGTGLTRDLSKAVQAYRKAADRGHVHARILLGYLYRDGKLGERDLSVAEHWFRMAAEIDDVWGLTVLGELYVFHKESAADHERGVKWVRTAASDGYKVAMYLLGLTTASGRGTPKDPAEALKWYRRAADLGHAGAMREIGWAYHKGAGVDQDDAEAILWLTRAADGDDGRAMNHLGWMFRHGCGTPQNEREAIAWYRKAAALGHSAALDGLDKPQSS